MWQATAVLGAMLAFVFWLYTGAIEDRARAQIAAGIAEKTIEYQKATADLSQANLDAIETLKSEQKRKTDANNAELDRYRDIASKLAQANPTSFGDDYHIKLGRIMCLIQGGSNLLDRETCRTAPDEAYLSNVALSLTVTAEQAEIWQELCEDGQKSFCEWSITGFTPNTAITVLQWLYRVDEYAKAQGDHIEGLHDLIKEITKGEDDDR